MLVYHFSEQNGEYLASGQADPNPLSPGEFLVPYNATADAPPVLGANKVAVRTNNAWVVQDDFRGTIYWLNGQQGEITDIGDTVPSGAVLIEPAPVMDNTDVNAERDRRILIGKSFTVTGYATPIMVAGDSTTQTNQMALAVAAQARIASGDVTTLTPYRDENNDIHQLTPPQVFELWSVGAAWVSLVYQASWAIKDDPAGIPSDIAGDSRWPP